MIVDLGSDLHLRFGGFDKLKIEDISSPDATVCILAGDILEAVDWKEKTKLARDAIAFCKSLSNRYEAVIYVMGNHEFYGNTFQYHV